MHQMAMRFVKTTKILQPSIFKGGKILECGSLNINGSVRELFESPDEYIGIDMRGGRGVDIVTFCHQYRSKPDGYFDVVISTEMLEHDSFWRQSIKRMLDLLKVKGSLVLTCASPLRSPHRPECASTKGYYKGLNVEQIVREVGRYSGFEMVVGAWNKGDSYVMGLRKG